MVEDKTIESHVQRPAESGGRIAILMHSMASGGSQYRVIWLANRFVALGRPVDLLLINELGKSAERLDPRVRVYALANSAGKTTGPRSWLSVFALARYLRRTKPALLMSGANRAHAVAMRGWSVSRRAVPVVLRLCNSAKVWPRDNSLAGIVRRLWGRDEELYGEADGLIAVARSTAEDFRRIRSIGDRQIDVIYNPTATRDFMERPLRDRRTNVAQVPTIVSAGTLQHRKDFPTLIRAFAIVRAKRPARLLILGEGPDRAALSALVADLGLANDVAMPGWCEDVPAALEKADLLVSASLFEGLPGTLIEALALGCPIVATDCPGASREILADGTLGRLVEVGDVDGMADAIISALDAPDDPAILRAGAERFHEEGKGEAYLQVFDRLISERKTGAAIG